MGACDRLVLPTFFSFTLQNNFSIGATDGIGKGFALVLAKRGFNIILLSRNKDKLVKVSKEVELSCKGVQTAVIVADCSDTY